jgi:hypothetical protein
MKSFRAHSARGIANNAPPKASTRLSVSICPTTRKRRAPNAVRTAISRLRLLARTSSRLATFTHAMSRTQPTATSSIISAGRVSPTKCSSSETVFVAGCLLLLSGYCFARARAITFISSRACSRVTPSLSRPTTERKCAPLTLVTGWDLGSLTSASVAKVRHNLGTSLSSGKT